MYADVWELRLRLVGELPRGCGNLAYFFCSASVELKRKHYSAYAVIGSDQSSDYRGILEFFQVLGITLL